jgi:hypothetical protein
MFSFLYWRPFFQVTSCSNRCGLFKEYFKIWLSMWREQEIKGSKNGYFTKFWLFSIYSWNWGEIKFYNFLGSKVVIWRNIFFICSISYWNAPNWSTRCGFEGCGFLNIIAFMDEKLRLFHLQVLLMSCHLMRWVVLMLYSIWMGFWSLQISR